MESATKALLRNAVLEALTQEEDAAAMEILSLLTNRQAPAVTTVEQLALPQAREVINGPARDYHYWARFIREHFIPFMTASGRMRFTSPELFTWLENCKALRLTTGDLEIVSSRNREVWRGLVSNALASMKEQGVIRAQTFGRVYEIVAPALPSR